ncbi:hypothetical protein BN59_02735 [Legionella massiliensis]|uniref:GNAT family N-acetyltransferase n=1 Tax=Legionella massiliensis TaxID=1034943 RepID=A0A078KVJ3_9GAMM|nr:hypothetical protein [Legionella massiliensis]CDZ78425.1 hypothetical protein BN59_02735 [Legionella massiliensis]CEE14163.1 hypothetical protein BN1094_02735 [Legionella massiliensis]
MNSDIALFNPMYTERKTLSLTSDTMESIAKTISGYSDPGMISFSKIKTTEEFELLGRFRLKNYSLKRTYMVAELDKKGLDYLDKSSTSYAAWFEGEMVATVRLTPAPFESPQLFDSDILRDFLGNNYDLRYLEWSRLLIKHHSTSLQLLPALITYAGLFTLASSPYQQYFGYCTPTAKKLFSRFLIVNCHHPFTIQRRRGNIYQLIKGNFLEDFLNLTNHGFNFEIANS